MDACDLMSRHIWIINFPGDYTPRKGMQTLLCHSAPGSALLGQPGMRHRLAGREIVRVTGAV